jgi:hypothetical protein
MQTKSHKKIKSWKEQINAFEIITQRLFLRFNSKDFK